MYWNAKGKEWENSLEFSDHVIWFSMPPVDKSDCLPPEFIISAWGFINEVELLQELMPLIYNNIDYLKHEASIFSNLIPIISELGPRLQGW